MLALLDPRAYRACSCSSCSILEHVEHINHVICLLARQALRAICVLRQSRVHSILTYFFRLVTLNFLFKLSSRKYEKCFLRKITIEHPFNENNFFFRTLNFCSSTCVFANFVSLQANNVCSKTHSRNVSRVLHRESFVILSFFLSSCEEYTRNEYVFETKCAKQKRSCNA